MTRALESLLRRATVRIEASGRPVGSGFFVAGSLVLTAAHVVRGHDDLVAFCDAERLGNLTARAVWPERTDAGGMEPLPDLALLELTDGPQDMVPVVELGDATPGEGDIYVAGCRAATTGPIVVDGARLRLESWTSVDGVAVVTLKDSAVGSGMSGGPVLDLATGRVVGVLKQSRSVRGPRGTDVVGPLGAVAVAVSALRNLAPKVWEASFEGARAHPQWEFARRAGTSTTQPVDATRRYLAHVREVVRARPAIVPPGRDAESIEQTLPLREVRPEDAEALSGEAARSTEDDPPALVDGGTSGATRRIWWNPLRPPSRVVVVSGAPGSGKSSLVNRHTRVTAEAADARMREDDTASFLVEVPVVADCAVLARNLGERADREFVLAALTRGAVSGARTDDEMLADDACHAVVEVALRSGRAIVCLDALDEVPEAGRPLVQSALGHIADLGNQLVVTSRPRPQLEVDIAQLRGTFRAEALGFEPSQSVAFVRAWFTAASDPRLGERVARETVVRPELAELMRVPLLAALLCGLVMTRSTVEALPTSAATLLDAVVTAALRGEWRAEDDRVVHPESPPDDGVRLPLLARAVGRLCAGWRVRPHRFAAAEFDAALREDREYEQARRAAQLRWSLWAEWQTGEPTPPPDVVRWELLHDGLLTYETAVSGRPLFLRFVHSALADYCLARQVAGLTGAGLRDVIESHRWFDSGWEQVWPLVGELAQAPGEIVEDLLDHADDAWFEQTRLACCVAAGAGANLPADVAERLTSRVGKWASSSRLVDRERAVTSLVRLVRAGVPGAVGLAVAIDPKRIPLRAQAAVLAARADVGDAEAVDRALALLVDAARPVAFRRALAPVATRVGGERGVSALVDALRSVSSRTAAFQQLAAGIAVETGPGAEVATELVRDRRLPDSSRAVLGSLLIDRGDFKTVTAVREMALDPLTNGPLRAALLASLLYRGDADATLLEAGVRLAQDPNLTEAGAIDLIEALVRLGELQVLTDAARYLVRSSVRWQARQRLARAVAQSGADGVELLERTVAATLPLGLKVRPIIALVEVGRGTAEALRIAQDSGTELWIRLRCATALARHGSGGLDTDALELLVESAEGEEVDFAAELVSTAATQGLGSSARLAVALVRAAGSDLSGTGQRTATLLRALGRSGRVGAHALARIASDPECDEHYRALAIVSLAAGSPVDAARLASEHLDKFGAVVRDRLVVMLAERDVVEVLDLVPGSVLDAEERYRTVLGLVGGDRAAQHDHVRGRGLLASAEPGRPDDGALRRSVARETIGEELLAAGVEWGSEAEREHMIEWFMGRVELRVGARIAVFLSDELQDEFDQQEHEEEQEEFRRSYFGPDRLIVQEALEAAYVEVRRDPGQVPRLEVRSQDSGMGKIVTTAQVLREWARIAEQGEPNPLADFFASNAPVLASTLAFELLALVSHHHAAHYPYRGLTYLVKRALETHGIEETVRFVVDSSHQHDMLRRHLAEGQGGHLFHGALAGLLVAPRSASLHFYGALGAELEKAEAFATELMTASHGYATDDQRVQGVATIRATSGRCGWTADREAALVRALETGTAKEPS